MTDPHALFALVLLSALPSCGENDVVVATITDSAVPEAAPIPCTESDAGVSDCPDGSFCSVATCGSNGTCEPIPTSDSCTDEAYEPECGCDGITYFNGCLRRAASTSRAAGETCSFEFDPTAPKKGMLRPCDAEGTLNQCGPNESCVALIPSQILEYVDAGPPGAPPGAYFTCATVDDGARFTGSSCWVLPDTCSSSDAQNVRTCESDTCVEACTAFKKGGVYFLCP